MSPLSLHPALALLDWTQIVPIVLILSGAGLLLAAIWRGQRGLRAGANPAISPPAPSVQTVMRDAEELTGLLAGQMERQAARLERLIAEADLKIKRLERMLIETPRGQPLEPGSAGDPVCQRIYELADEGVPPVDIARELKTQTGKVQLILALRRKQRVTTGA